MAESAHWPQVTLIRLARSDCIVEEWTPRQSLDRPCFRMYS